EVTTGEARDTGDEDATGHERRLARRDGDRVRGERQTDRERAALALGARDGDLAAVLFDHLANDREPDATAGDATGHVRAAGERLEGACEVCLRDTDALVGDSALSDVTARRVSRADAYPHTAVLAVVLDRVRHEVRDGALETGCVPLADDRPVRLDDHLLPVPDVADIGDNTANDLDEVGRRATHLERRIGVPAHELEQLLDERVHARDRATDARGHRVCVAIAAPA